MFILRDQTFDAALQAAYELWKQHERRLAEEVLRRWFDDNPETRIRLANFSEDHAGIPPQ